MSEFATLYKTDTRLQNRKNNILNADGDAHLYEFRVNYLNERHTSHTSDTGHTSTDKVDIIDRRL